MPTAHTVARCRSRRRENDTGNETHAERGLSASPSAQIMVTGYWLELENKVATGL